MNVGDLLQKEFEKGHWLLWRYGEFEVVGKKPKHKESNREAFSRYYKACTDQLVQQGLDKQLASQSLRKIWIEEVPAKPPKNLPRVIGEDAFLRLYARGTPLSVALARRVWQRLQTPPSGSIDLNPIEVHWNLQANRFYDIDATPLGVLPKLFPYFRLKQDRELLKKVQSDLREMVHIEDHELRKWVALGVLSHGAAYREIDGLTLEIPSFEVAGELIEVECTRHMLAEGVKTLSLTPKQKGWGIYLCQGTELWPSQPSFFGSIMANFAVHGSATAVYAHSWRRIHKHLRDLYEASGRLPIVTGHSMGGALAMQIALYSHDLIDKSYAYNPPQPNKRDYQFYHLISKSLQEKLVVSANIDDFAFWRIGARVMGQINLFLCRKRWRYYPVKMLDCIFIFPAFIKFIFNVRHAFPAHQSIIPLRESYLKVQLTQQEIDTENEERLKRFDYLHFFPKLYDPTKTFFRYFRKLFKWRFEEHYLKNEVEIVALHERDIIDTLDDDNREEIERELQELNAQKARLIDQLNQVIGRK